MITTYSFTNNNFSFSKGVVLALEKYDQKFFFAELFDCRLSPLEM